MIDMSAAGEKIIFRVALHVKICHGLTSNSLTTFPPSQLGGESPGGGGGGKGREVMRRGRRRLMEDGSLDDESVEELHQTYRNMLHSVS